MNFGQTWWGKQWLDAFNGIDYSNRLPRGRTYARNGSVTQLEILDTRITARVSGSRRQDYRVSIEMAVFSEEQQAAILTRLTSSPVLLSRLLNRQLPTALLNDLQQIDIQLFPDSWDDMHAHCSCPDWATMCKHLAAVLYGVGARLDDSPEKLFELRGVDEKELIISFANNSKCSEISK